MKPDPTHRRNGPPPVNRAGPVTAARKQANLVRQKRRMNRATLRQAVWIGAVAIVAALAALDWLKPSPKRPPVAAAKAVPAPLAAKPAKTLTADPAAMPAADTPAATAQPASIPPPLAAEPIVGEAAKQAAAAERLLAEPPLLLAGPDALREAALTRDHDLLKRAIDDRAWDAYRGLLAKSITAGLARVAPGQGLGRFDPVWKEAALYQALLRWKTLGCFPESDIAAVVTDRYTAGMLLWMLHDNQAMEELLLTIQPQDDGGKVLKFLMETWSINPDRYQKYFSLALACAVVFEQPVAVPNSVGDPKFGVETEVEPLKRYRWFVDKSEKGLLAAPVHHSSARDLVWVVCAPVTTSELEWSLDKMQMHRKSWGSAYSKVRYLIERAVNGLNPYKEYSFAEILKEGGICGDQAYFCVNTARAQGIPAMIISGETNSGGHSWAGLKTDATEWSTQTGRVAGAAKGEAANPQTGASISEQEILLWNDRFHQSPLVTLAVWRHLWLTDFFAATHNTADSSSTIRLANNIGHSFVETWRALYGLLVSQTKLTGTPPAPDNLAEWKAFAKDMRREFRDNPRMVQLAATAEAEYIFPYGPESEAKLSLTRERRRIERDAGEQTDLIAASLKRQAELITKQGGPGAKREISQLYDRALRDYGGSITGFKIMAEDYFGYFRDDKELARKTARDIELAFRRCVETGSSSWFRVNVQADICKMICGYYRSAGEPERATMLEKRYDVMLKRAKRGAL